jgi:hypothetical protein
MVFPKSEYLDVRLGPRRALYFATEHRHTVPTRGEIGNLIQQPHGVPPPARLMKIWGFMSLMPAYGDETERRCGHL